MVGEFGKFGFCWVVSGWSLVFCFWDFGVVWFFCDGVGED